MCLATPQLLLFTTVASGVSGMLSANAKGKEALRAGQRTAERIEQQKQVAQLNAEQETTALQPLVIAVCVGLHCKKGVKIVIKKVISIVGIISKFNFH